LEISSAGFNRNFGKENAKKRGIRKEMVRDSNHEIGRRTIAGLFT